MTEHYVVKNWKQFQHYTNRNPLWIKLHYELLSSEVWCILDDASRVLAVTCMLVASRNDGLVPNKPDYLKRVGYLNRRPNLKPLIEAGFLEIPLADASALQADASRVYQDARPELEGELKTELETEKKGYAYQGKVIKITHAHLAEWQKTFHAIPDILALLPEKDDYLVRSPRKAWMGFVSSQLAEYHQKMLLRKQQETPRPRYSDERTNVGTL